MMEVLVDGVLFPVNLREGDPVQVAVDAIRLQMLARRRAITSIALDGTIVLAQEEKPFFQAPAASRRKLEVTTEDPARLALNVIRQLEPFLDQLQTAHEHAAEYLHRGKMKEFQELLVGCVQGWDLLIGGVRNLGPLLATMPSAPKLPVEEMKANVAILTRAVAGLKTSIQTQDPSRLADVMEYDLAERLPFWKKTLADLRAVLET